MSEEGANPVSGDAVAQHGIAILACRYNVELILVQDGREVDVWNRARVSVAGKRNDLGGLRHCIGSRWCNLDPVAPSLPKLEDTERRIGSGLM